MIDKPDYAGDILDSQATACTVSVITSDRPSRLAKRFSLGADGSLIKEEGGAMQRGHYRRASADTAEQLASLIADLETNQALNFGSAGPHERTIGTKNSARPDDITRTQSYFDWPATPGWLMVDYDAEAGREPLKPLEVLGALDAALASDPINGSALIDAPLVSVDSGSAWIYNRDSGECLKGRGGHRWYIKIADARDIERAGEALFNRLWLAGHGYYTVSAAGSGLCRSIIDKAVYRPERLDFAAGAATDAPLEQRRAVPSVFNSEAEPLDTLTAIPDLNPEEKARVEFLQRCAFDATDSARQAAREAWLKANTDRQAEREGVDDAKGRGRIRRALSRSLDGGVLQGGFALKRCDGEAVTVQMLLDDPDEFDREQFFDPLEPTYNDNGTVAIAYLSEGRPRIWSQAHGGRMFHLEPDPAPWLDGWCYVRSLDKFFNSYQGVACSKQAFNLEHGKFIPLNRKGTAKVAQPAEYAAEHCELPFVDQVVYAPTLPETFEMGGLSCVNSFLWSSLPAAATELTEADQAAIDTVDRHISNICDGEPKKYAMLRDWLAFNAQNPGRKVRWVPLIKGIEGDGKSRLFDVLATALDGRNLSVVGPKVLMSDFNGFAEGACAVALEEIRMEGHSRFDAANALKAAITNDTIEIHRKGADSYTVLNATNYIAFSNHADCVPISDTDRRWAPIFTPWQTQREMAERIGEPLESYFDRLTDAINRHGPAICAWLRTLQVSDSFSPDGRAPETPEKAIMRFQGEDEETQLVREAIEAGGYGIGADILAMGCLSQSLRGLELQGEDVPSANRVAAILKRLGWMKDRKVRWNGKSYHVWFKGRAPKDTDEARDRLGKTGDM